MEDMKKITNPTFEAAEGVQGTKGASLQHVASKNRMVKLNNLAYLEKVLNSSGSQNDRRIKIIEKEVDRLIKTKPKNYVQRINDLNTEGMALASGYIKKDGKIVKGPTAGYSEFRVKDPLNEKLSYFGKDDTKTLLPDRDPVLIQQDANLIDKPIKDMNPKELKRAKEIARKKQIDFRKIMSGTGKILKGVVKPVGYAIGPFAVMSARAKAEDMGIELSIADQAMAFESGDPEVAINNARRRVDPEFAAQERAKDLARMPDDFEEVGLDNIMEEYTEDYKI